MAIDVSSPAANNGYASSLGRSCVTVFLGFPPKTEIGAWGIDNAPGRMLTVRLMGELTDGGRVAWRQQGAARDDCGRRRIHARPAR